MSIAWILQLHWREPLWLLLTLQPLLMYMASKARTRKTLAAYADITLAPWVRPPRNANTAAQSRRTIVYNIAWFLFAIAAAGPRYAMEYMPDNASDKMDVAVVVDVSQSMQAADVLPNRIQKAKLELLEWLPRLHGERVAVIVYAAQAHLYVPLTHDYDALRFYLNSLDKLVLPTSGSHIQPAVELAKQELSRSHHHKALVLIGDGEFANSRNIQSIADSVQKSAIKLAVLGVGTVEGDVIPLSGGGWLYQDGKAVISRLQESNLRQLADLSGGFYATARDGNQDWALLYDQVIRGTGNGSLDMRDGTHVLWQELYQWALFPAVLLFFYAVIPYRFSVSRGAAVNTLWLLPLCAVLSGFHDAQAQDDGDLQSGYTSFQKSDYQAAADSFTNIPGYRGRLWEGASRYRLKQFDAAVKSFTQAVLNANNDRDRAVALYNLGNSYFQTGNYAAAEQVYEDALHYRDHHADTLHNLVISKSLKQLVEQRSRATAVSNRTGRGPRQALAQKNLLLGESDSVTLDQSTESDTETKPDPGLAKLDHAQLEYLIKRGLPFVHSVTQDSDNGRQALWSREAPQIELVENTVSSDNARLWQRIFEIEEGFPAPLDASVTLPGTPPW